jgi:wobble nucleotide-excising tRNase
MCTAESFACDGCSNTFESKTMLQTHQGVCVPYQVKTMIEVERQKLQREFKDLLAAERKTMEATMEAERKTMEAERKKMEAQFREKSLQEEKSMKEAMIESTVEVIAGLQAQVDGWKKRVAEIDAELAG